MERPSKHAPLATNQMQTASSSAEPCVHERVNANTRVRISNAADAHPHIEYYCRFCHTYHDGSHAATPKALDIERVRERTKKRRLEIDEETATRRDVDVARGVAAVNAAIERAIGEGENRAHVVLEAQRRLVAMHFDEYKCDFTCRDRDECMWSCQCLTISW